MKRLPSRKAVKLAFVGILFLSTAAYYFVKRLTKIPSQRVGELHSQFAAKENLTFFAVGDTGTGEASQFAVAEALEARCQQVEKLDGILLLGDIVYPSGITSIHDPKVEAIIAKPYSSPCLKSVPIYPILGNHDYKGNPGALIDYSKVDKRWHLPSRFYTLSFGSLLKVVAIDTAFPDFCFMKEQCSMDFLLHEMKDSDHQWVVVTGHHPLSSASTKGYSHSGGAFGFFLRPFVCGHPDAWLAGHSHHLEHRQLEGCKTDLFIAGGGGAGLYKVNQEPESKFAATSLGYLEMQVSAKEIEWTFRNQDNAVLYTTKQAK